MTDNISKNVSKTEGVIKEEIANLIELFLYATLLKSVISSQDQDPLSPNQLGSTNIFVILSRQLLKNYFLKYGSGLFKVI